LFRDSVDVAKDLLGKVVVSTLRRNSSKNQLILITETEAYLGKEDLASHARFGLTKRNETMYMSGGIWYVYMIYGMYYMLNVVVGEKDFPGAVLIRAGIKCSGTKNNKLIFSEKVNGPGLVSKLLYVDYKINSKIITKNTGLYIDDFDIKVNNIEKLSRINIQYSGKKWANKNLDLNLFINLTLHYIFCSCLCERSEAIHVVSCLCERSEAIQSYGHQATVDAHAWIASALR